MEMRAARHPCGPDTTSTAGADAGSGAESTTAARPGTRPCAAAVSAAPDAGLATPSKHCRYAGIGPMSDM
jgi:hypothetical protein